MLEAYNKSTAVQNAPPLGYADLNSKEPLVLVTDSSQQSCGYYLYQNQKCVATGKLVKKYNRELYKHFLVIAIKLFMDKQETSRVKLLNTRGIPIYSVVDQIPYYIEILEYVRCYYLSYRNALI